MADHDTALRVCQRVQRAIAQPLACCEGYQLGAAIGIALFPEDGRDAATLLQAADQAMYADNPPYSRALTKNKEGERFIL